MIITALNSRESTEVDIANALKSKKKCILTTREKKNTHLKDPCYACNKVYL